MSVTSPDYLCAFLSIIINFNSYVWMFINSSLIDQNPYETTSSYIEDETIQLINYYGRQLIEYLDEDKNIKHKVRDIKDHMAHHHVKT